MLKKLEIVGYRLGMFIPHDFFQFISPFIAGVIAPSALFLQGLFILWLGDLFGGIAVALKEKRAIEAKKLFISILKFFVMGICILLATYLELFVNTGIPMGKVVTMYICYHELKSIDEKCVKLFGYSIFSAITKGIGKLIKNEVKKEREL